MKLDTSWIAAALIAAAGLFGFGSQLGGKPTLQSTVGGAGDTLKAETTGNFSAGPCAELEKTLQSFLWTPASAIAAPASCYQPGQVARGPAAKLKSSAAGTLEGGASTLRFVIAVVPDPLHTHFSLGFDRLAESIQQGVQDEGYFYDSSWMPWEKADRGAGGGQEKTEEQGKAREEQPGVLLFRGRPQPDQPSAAEQPYRNGLAVFLVGEEPTTGIHKRQFENALDWISALQPQASDGPGVGGLSILGPSFSGSLPSLAQLLSRDADQLARLTVHSPHGELMVFSGGITSLSLVSWFARLPQPGGKLKVRFRSFQADGDTLLERYRRYLVQQKFDLRRLAILSEDETAFGGYSDMGRVVSGPCAPEPGKDVGPACLYFPRDISALREAYQKESIFTSTEARQTADTAQRTLTGDFADTAGRQHDTIRNYSGNQTALSQEAVLQQIVSMLKAHDSQYVVLRSSNPLDQLFLSHYLKLAYPQGRIVVEGSDLLLGRESGAAALSGIMTLTTYPLLPWEHHWTGLAGTLSSHSHRIFAQEGAEGNYVATRFLMHPACIAEGPDPLEKGKIAATRFLPRNCTGALIPNYAPPFWAQPPPDGSRRLIDPANGWQRPAVWLSVLGRDGFWPVAALDETSLPTAQSLGSRLSHALAALPRSLLLLFAPGSHTSGAAGGQALLPREAVWPPLPLSMKLALLALLLCAGFHFHCCLRASLTVKPGHRAHFVRLEGRSHLALLLFGSVMLATIPIFLGWGYGAMSPYGEPLPHPWWSRTFLPLSWTLAGLALAANILIEPVYGQPTLLGRLKSRPRLPLLIQVLGLYLLWTYLLYALVDFFLDETLLPANRIPTYWRSIHLTSGVSPLLPMVALTTGFYLWFWYSLQGLALFGADRPLLPTSEQLELSGPRNEMGQPEMLRFLCMFSQDRGARPLEQVSHPFSREAMGIAACLFPAIAFVTYLLAGGVPVRSLGSRDYSILFCLGMDVCISLLLANTWQLLRVWLRLRQMLLFLDRLPLRRTMIALKGYSWGSVWKMGGNVLDVRYKLLSRQLESLTHLANSLDCPEGQQEPELCREVQATQSARTDFAVWYARNWDNWNERDLSKLQLFQQSVARTAGKSLAGMVIKEWRSEHHSLLVEGEKAETPGGGLGEACRNAEELICLVYLGFVQNVLARMRALVTGMAWLFVAATVSVATYPFDPRPVVSGAMLALFGVIGLAIVVVYSQMHRDATLSYVTNTKPGELGIQFWTKLLGLGAGPLLGLLATIFPQLPGSLLALVQPGLSALK